MKTICILCPVYREAEGISAFHARLRLALEPLRSRYVLKVVYALDPSPDDTEAVLRGLSESDPEVEVFVMSRRFGHQAALVAGMEHCRGDALVMLDSDCQHPPELIPDLVHKWEGGADIVQTVRQDGAEAGWLRRATSRWFYRVFMSIGSVGLNSGAADYRLLSARVLDVFRRDMREHNPFLRGLVTWVGFNICYVSFVPERRSMGRSKYRASTLFNFALSGICSFSKTPLRMAIISGIVIAALSFLFGALQIIAYYLGAPRVPGWASLFLAMSLFSGIQLFFLGLLGEYVGLIFDEVKGRPRYLLRTRYRRGQAFDAAMVASTTDRDAER